MSPSDLWLLHRERILVGFGIALCVASVVVLIPEVDDADSGYDIGSLLGATARNIAIGFVVGLVATYLWRRHYWLDEDTHWFIITPEAAAVAGPVVLVLAITVGIIGGPDSSSDSGSLEQLAGDGEACFELGSPMEGFPRDEFIELSDKEVERVYPELASAPAEVRELQRHYLFGRGETALVVTFLAVGGENLSDPDFFEDFAKGSESTGATATLTDLDGREVVEVTRPETTEAAISAQVGCNVATIIARDLDTARKLGGELLGRLDPAQT